ncbi:hypothetical protein WJX72_010327 [[Myrmecia] bisecta]|uniref:Activating signal cointegrator 1 complex subunit 3 n=1 Tax=[Myrmecia] bisecta TaxID=41462 RepID=A0AAW1Q1V5_9CHLO
MGGGQALTATYGTQTQVPRLTTMLRAFATESGGIVDVDAQYLQRAKDLEGKLAAEQAHGVGTSALAREVLGEWTKAPKAAREDYEHFVRAVSRLLGGESSAQEVQESAALVWALLKKAPGPDELAKKTPKGAAAAMQPFKDAVQAAVGPLEEPAFQGVLAALAKLKGWQGKLGGMSGPAQADSKASSKGDAAVEFGAELEFHYPRLHEGTDAAMLASSHASSAGAGAQPLPDRLPAGQAPSDSVQGMRDLFASLGKAPEPGPSTSAYVAPLDDVDEGELGPKRRAASKVGAKWLREWCGRASGASALDSADDSLAMAVCRVLLLGRSGDEAAAELFDLLGDTAFESIQELLEHRKDLTANLRAQISAQREAEAGDKSNMPTYGTTVSITSGSQRLLDKLDRKDKRKSAKGKSGLDPDLDWLSVNGIDVLVEAELMRETQASASSLIFNDGMEFKIGDGTLARNRLPVGTTRRAFKGYEEVHVPAIKTAVPPPGEQVVLIEDMEDWAQTAFEGYKKLNRIQSRIYPTAFHSNENVLVCAPTGAGKTNIAMIAVLREVAQNMRHGVIQRDAFKVVYVAPMKALAAEVTAAFSRRLQNLGLNVRELTGDMQLSKKELAETQMIVTTPEKWDVITRKGGDVSVAASVRLLIIDEVHLLNDDRGPVIETLIARTQRQVEASQSMIRIVGLSATLPNYKDVATFLGVNVDTGLFYFDASYRPVPLEMQFVGVSERNMMAARALMDELAYQKVVDSLKKGHQAMVFVHSRKDTGKTARALMMKAQNYGDLALWDGQEHPRWAFAQKDVKKSRNKEVQELFPAGLGIHHAGMLRSDRNLTERLFSDGLLKVLCCTATLAWGVNLPAHTVIIKGTQLYDAQKGAFKDLGMLDVQQIFGRAGRPQFEDSGEGIIITQHDKLAHYLGMLTHQLPIESQFVKGMVDNLNAEIVLGTVTSVREASLWLSYTYLFVRMVRNPLPYGIPWEELGADPRLEGRRKTLIVEAARELERSKMARFDEKSGNLYVTELGRVASHYYIRHSSIVVFNELLKRHMSEAEILAMMAQSSEFENMAVREDELPELDTLMRGCPFEVRGGAENKHGKVNILLQAFVSRARVESFSLIADLMYVSQNAPRIARALFEICLRRGWSSLADMMLTMSKSFERRLWLHQHLLRQFEGAISPDLLFKLEDRGLWMERLEDMSAGDIGALLRHPAAGANIRACMDAFPRLSLDAQLQPITRTVLRVALTLEAAFQWREREQGAGLKWHIWVEDAENEHIYHAETWLLTRKMMREPAHRIAFTIPIFEPLPPQYYIRAVSDSWLGAEAFLAVSFKGLILPELHPPHTQLLDLDPLPLSALNNPAYEAMYSFSHFNPIQTQAFHTLYHTDENVLLGAPTGSGKTISAELAMMRVFNQHPDQKIIYIAPLKALVRERIKDWGAGLCRRLGKRMVELTGDFTPDMRALLAADIIIVTPEKWDGISRAWQNRSYVTKVGLLIIDEIHLLGADRGPILEVIVSRMRYIAAQTSRAIRFVGLSTALANAVDLADWLGIKPQGLFNFKPSVRPVPLECHIQGYPGKFYCPRMATMNKPAYAAIQTHSPLKPVLVFVSSRRQTRLTALDLIAYAAADERPRQFVHMPEDELDHTLAAIQDANLRHSLQFGIGLHHAGLGESDRSTVEALYVGGKIQVLVATSTLAWGVNTPAHLVIIKGTEYFDAPSKRYVDFPITDVLQMMGRAGRPQYDRHGVAVIMVAEPKKSFYKKFLYEPFPVESSLRDQIADHFNAEIVAGTIGSAQDAVDYFTWTFFFRRLLQNPSYYDLPATSAADVNLYLSDLVEHTFAVLQDAGCMTVDEDRCEALTMGRIASYYYLRHESMAVFARRLAPGLDTRALLPVLCAVAEYDELPVRHNEDKLNATLASQVRWRVDPRTVDDPHTKANLLLQAHMARLDAPISDYITDTKSVLDQSLRILQAMTDIAADAGWLDTALSTMALVQGLMQGCWADQSPFLQLPHMTRDAAAALGARYASLADLLNALRSRSSEARQALGQALGGDARAVADCIKVCERLPLVEVSWQQPRLQAQHAQHHEAGTGEAGAAQYVVDVQLRRLAGKRSGAGPARVYAPRFPKVKEEGWWLVVGDARTRELHALKRLSFGERAAAHLTFPAADGAGRPLTGISLFLVSDSYLGLDRQEWAAISPEAPAPPRWVLSGLAGPGQDTLPEQADMRREDLTPANSQQQMLEREYDDDMQDCG